MITQASQIPRTTRGVSRFTVLSMLFLTLQGMAAVAAETPAGVQSEDAIADSLMAMPTMAARAAAGRVPLAPERYGCETPVAPDPASTEAAPASLASAHRNLYPAAAPSIDLDVAFEFGLARLTDAGRAQLDQLAGALRRPELASEQFTLAGHTDAKGAKDFNLRLSCARALAVKDYLAGHQGIAADRLRTLGFGDTLLKNRADPLDGVNRRVEVRRLDD